jgi:hypothetical protein
MTSLGTVVGSERPLVNGEQGPLEPGPAAFGPLVRAPLVSPGAQRRTVRRCHRRRPEQPCSGLIDGLVDGLVTQPHHRWSG